MAATLGFAVLDRGSLPHLHKTGETQPEANLVMLIGRCRGPRPAPLRSSSVVDDALVIKESRRTGLGQSIVA